MGLHAVSIQSQAAEAPAFCGQPCCCQRLLAMLTQFSDMLYLRLTKEPDCCPHCRPTFKTSDGAREGQQLQQLQLSYNQRGPGPTANRPIGHRLVLERHG